MAEEIKKDDCGCGGCGCGRSKQNGECENASGCKASSPATSLGEAIATGAIIKMENVTTEEKNDVDTKITEADIDGFIEKCDKEGKNPLDVVKFIAEINGIDISSECMPKDASKRSVYELLKGVVKKVIIGFVSYCADNYGLDFIKSLINSCGSCSEKSSRSSGNGSETSAEVCPVYVGMLPGRVGYVIKW
jgi:hypothetical protein